MSIAGKRKCANCRFFADAELAGNGWCTNPKRQVSSDVRILVRKGELACRNSWGGDLWESSNGSTAANGTVSSARATFEASIPMPKFEDQVTSVVTSDANPSPRGKSPSASREEGHMSVPPEDQVVAYDSIESPKRRQTDQPNAQDINPLAHADQHERANVMARGGPREAILRARERHRQRNSSPTRANEAMRRDSAKPNDDLVQATQSVPSGDDVPTDTGTETDGPAPQDRLIETRQRAPSTPPIDPFRRSYNDPAPPVPRSELPAGAEALSNRSGERNRFDSVPEVRPDIELPRRQPPTSPTRRRAEAARQKQRGDLSAQAPDVESSSTRSVDGGGGQSRNIRAAAKAFRDKRNNLQAPRLSSPSQNGLTPLPDDGDFDDPLPTPAAVREPDGVPASRAGSEVAPTRRDTLPNEAQQSAQSYAEDAVGDDMQLGPIGFDAAINDHPDDALFFDEFEDQPVTVRRRSWLTGLGRRRQHAPDSTPPPTATFPLQRAAQTSLQDADGASPATGTPEPEPEVTTSTAVNAATRDHATDAPATDHRPDFSPPSRPKPQETRPGTEGPRIRQFVAARPSNKDENEPQEGTVETQPHQEETPAATPAPVQPLRPIASRPHPQVDQPRHHATDYDMAELRRRLFGAVPANKPGNDSPGNGRPRTQANARPAMSAASERAPEPEPDPSRTPIHAVEDRAHIDAVAPFDEVPTVEPAPGFDLRSLMDRQRDPIDMRIKVAPGTPRVCRTCRSFRPSENDERGWCTNEWAFTHRRMVNAGDRPCQTSIGCWWLPDDGVWLKDDALAAFDEATPLMDQVLSRYERRRVGER